MDDGHAVITGSAYSAPELNHERCAPARCVPGRLGDAAHVEHVAGAVSAAEVFGSHWCVEVWHQERYEFDMPPTAGFYKAAALASEDQASGDAVHRGDPAPALPPSGDQHWHATGRDVPGKFCGETLPAVHSSPKLSRCASSAALLWAWARV